MLQNLPRLDQEPRPGLGQLHMPRRPVDELHTDGPLEALHLPGQRGGNDMLAGGGTPEMQLLGQGHEVAQLA